MLVNRHAGIAVRYHRIHDQAHGIQKMVSWIYLLWLNIAYYIFFCRFPETDEITVYYEKKKLITKYPEASVTYKNKNEYIEKLCQYDIISFDIFDTLILRPFSDAADLFFLVGNELGYMDFKRIRIKAEQNARWLKYQKTGSWEVSLQEIWIQVETDTGIDYKLGMQTELKYEQMLCHSNPFFKEIYDVLCKMGKKIVIISDMYLSEEFLKELLNEKGIKGFERLYVSCEYNESKAAGTLYRRVRSENGNLLRYIHVGDNPKSDMRMAVRNGFDICPYENVNKNSLKYRAYDMSPVIGGAYRGIVNNHIHCGLYHTSIPYEYGFIYGGLFVTGYCTFIHHYCESHGIDMILFLSRDGAILQRAYQMIYPYEKTEYAYLSRLSSGKLSAGYFKYDYIRKFVIHKVNKGYMLSEILSVMELDNLADKLTEELPSGNITDVLTDKNVDNFCRFLNCHWLEILNSYEEQRKAAGIWYKNLIGNSSQAAVVDIGWAGSGALALDVLFRKEWKLNCRITGIIAGTNTAGCAEPDMSETFLLNGKLVSYLYSSCNNRDLWKKHNPAKNYNLYWELLTSSEEPSFRGFYMDGSDNVKLEFQRPEENKKGGIREIHQGIIDFVKAYTKQFENIPYMFHISGRDAYAPMLVAASCGEKYLKTVYRDFALCEEVGAGKKD